MSQSGTWPVGCDMKNCNFRNNLEYLYAKCFFSVHTARRFQESESCAGILFMKIHVGIAHFVATAQSCCHKVALGPIGCDIKKLQLSE